MPSAASIFSWLHFVTDSASFQSCFMHFLFTEYRKHLACDLLQAGSLGYFGLLQSTASILLAIFSKLEAWVTLGCCRVPQASCLRSSPSWKLGLLFYAMPPPQSQFPLSSSRITVEFAPFEGDICNPAVVPHEGYLEVKRREPQLLERYLATSERVDYWKQRIVKVLELIERRSV